MFNNQDQIFNGTTVYDATGEKVGTVHDNNVQEGYLLVQKGWLFPKDFYVPMGAVERVDDAGVFLRISKDELVNAQYDEPPMALDQTLAAPRGGGTVGVVDREVETATGDIRVPVREEELVVGKQMEEAGRVHIHKEVVTEQQTVSVPLRQERVTVERVPLSGDLPLGDDAFVERDIEVPVMGEEAVVGKRVMGVEEVVVRKDVMTEQEQVTDSVRKERVMVDGVDAAGQATTSGRTAATGTSGSSTVSATSTAAKNAAQSAGDVAKGAGTAAKSAAQSAGDDLGRAKDTVTGQ